MAVSNPRISIITVVFNAVATLEKTIRSVLNQPVAVDFVVVDGGSTDGTLDIIRRYENQLGAWVSEGDRGIYDAMNKGIGMATGDWFYFLGADDHLQPGALEQIVSQLDEQYDLVFGDVISDQGRRFHSFFGPKTILSNTIHHQGAFYHRRLFEQFRYDTNQRIMADYELNLMLYKAKRPYRKVDVLVATCGTAGISTVDKRSLTETNAVRGKHYGGLVNAVLSAVLRVKYYVHYELLRKV